MSTNISKISYPEFFIVFMLSCFTVISGLVIFELDKNYNTPLINSIFIKAISFISVICVGVFIFKESYKIHQILGICLIIIGIYLASQKNF
jgi:drug/metabolite transporter (DMT)-like permease